MKDAKNKNVNQEVTPEQMLVAEDENGRELTDRQLKGVVGGITAPQITEQNVKNLIEMRGKIRNPF